MKDFNGPVFVKKANQWQAVLIIDDKRQEQWFDTEEEAKTAIEKFINEP